jgi:carotenoid cleavage dioxygenase
VHEEQVDDRSAEFPRVADSQIARPYRYGYMMSANGRPDRPEEQAGAILKYDRQTGTRSALELGRGRVGGEPVFAPAENPKHEDDGYLMTFVYDAATNASEYVVYDAASMDDQPLARVELPRIPSGFHGSWVPSSVAN